MKKKKKTSGNESASAAGRQWRAAISGEKREKGRFKEFILKGGGLVEGGSTNNEGKRNCFCMLIWNERFFSGRGDGKCVADYQSDFCATPIKFRSVPWHFDLSPNMRNVWKRSDRITRIYRGTNGEHGGHLNAKDISIK